MKVFARAGLPATREAHARLFVNDEFAGVYVIVEPIDRTFITRVFGEAEGNVESGGYLYEYNWVREYGFEYLGPSLEAYAEIFESEDARDRRGIAALPAARNADPRHQRDAGRPVRAARSAR